uniref:DEAD-box RNA helicase Q domain-containing protein n=1 Tax=Gopherus agassizii TaxID=38772 RepID=A0A452HWJ5_9SAUR
MESVTEGRWESLPVTLSPGVLQTLRELGFPHMTPVQPSRRCPPPVQWRLL